MDTNRLSSILRNLFRSRGLPILAAAAVMGLLLVYLLSGKPQYAGTAEATPPESLPAQASPVLPGEIAHAADVRYICPMNCIPPAEKPGLCPVCGMELVAAFDEARDAHHLSSTVVLEPEAVQTAGVRVAAAERKFVKTEIRLFGKIEYDPTEQYQVTAFAPGVIDKIYVKRPGVGVRKGDALFDLHSAELYFLEEELFEVLKKFPVALDARPGRGQRFKRWVRPWMAPAQPARPDEKGGMEVAEEEAALKEVEMIRRKMRLLGLSEMDVDRVIARGSPTGITTLTSPTTGIVLDHDAYKGKYVNTGDVIMNIGNPGYLWARLDAYESDFPWIRFGQEAEFTTYAFPGETFKGKVVNIDPEFVSRTRTFKVGVLYTDPNNRLEPNMLVRCVIYAEPTARKGAIRRVARQDKKEPPVVIPVTAPLLTGKRAIVYVEVPGKAGRYEGREIDLGPRAGDYYVVNSGLMEGERVVVNGNFKIDSAIQILARPSMMNPEKKMGAALHSHGADGQTGAGGDPARHEQTESGPKHKMYGGPRPEMDGHAHTHEDDTD